MAFTCMSDSIIFVEGEIKNSQFVQLANCDLSFKFGAQLKSLNDVKKSLIGQAKMAGGNGIANFTYGQKSRWLALDDVAYWGKGEIVKISEDYYQELAEQCANK